MLKKLQIKSWLLMLCMLLGVGNAWASTYTYDFSTGGVYDETSSPKTSTWTTAYFSIFQEQNTSTSPVGKYLTAPRWYKNHTITITPVDGCQITQIQINCNSSSYTGQDISASTGEITKSGNNSTWTGEITNSSALVLTMGTQCRPTSLVVTYESSATPISERPIISGAEAFLTSLEVTIAAEEGAKIYYTLDGTDPTTSSPQYNEAITLTATTTVKAIAKVDGKDASLVESKTFTKVSTILTIADAKAAVDAGTGVTGVCVEGVISQIDSYNSTYHSITYWISTDGTTTDQFEVYSGRGLNNTNFAAVTDLKVGDQVVIYGNIKKFNSTYEFDKENYIVSLIREDKQEAGLVYSATKYTYNIGGSFTPPTLNNPNNLTITYTSSNPDVATVAADGVVTLVANATGTTTITAAFTGDDTYLPGSASYTLTVVDPNAPGASAENPYTVAQARAAIDANTGVTGVYATGIVSQVDSYNSSAKTIQYWISDDGTTTDQLECYKAKGIDGADFESIEDVKVGDVVVVYGNLTKYGSTYEFAAGNQLVSLVRNNEKTPLPVISGQAGFLESATVTITAEEGATIYYTLDGTEPTTSSTVYTETITLTETTTIKAIAQVEGKEVSDVAESTFTKRSVMTVAEALAASPSVGVYVGGIISEIKSIDVSKYERAQYYISDDGNTTNQFLVYNGYFLNGVAFTADDQIQVGDEVVVYGDITTYQNVNQLAQNNYIVSHNRPVNPIISASNITLAYDAESGEIEYTIINPVEGTNLTATTDAEWISNIAVSGDKVTFTTTANEGTEDREAIITLSYTGAESKTVTVTQEHYVVDYAELPFEFDGGRADVASTIGLTQNGLGTDYSSALKLKFDGTGDYIVLKFNERPGTLTFDIKGNSFSDGTFKVQTSADGETYIDFETYTTLGDTQSEEFDNIAADVRYIKWVYTEKVNGNVALGNITLAKYAVKYAVNIDENITKGTVTADKTEATAGTTVTLTVTPDDDYILDALTVIGASGAVEVSEDYKFTMPAEDVTVTATFVPAPVVTNGYKKVTSSTELTDGEYLIVYEGALVAFNGGLETLDAVSNTIPVEISNNIIPSSTEVDAATFTIDVTAGTLKSKSGKYIGVSSNSNGLNQTEEAGTYTHTFSIDEDGNAVISAVFDESTMALRFNKTSGQTRFRYFKNAGQEAIQLYKKFTSSEEPVKGDVNGDGDVSIADVTALVNIILGKATPDTNPEYDFDAADVNGDGGVPTIADVTALVNIILGKE